MKIAICISGHLRTYQLPSVHSLFLQFKEYLSQFGSTDIFVSSWNRQNTNNSWSSSHRLNDPNTTDYILTAEEVKDHYKTDNVELYNYDFFNSSAYSSLAYEYFTSVEYNWDKRAIHNNILHSTKMFYLIYQCNFQKTQYEYNKGFKYDYVFRIRPDHAFDLNQCEIINLHNSSQNILYIPIHNDRFAYGSSNIMNKYSSSIYHISSIFQQGIFGDPERIQRLCIESVIDSKNIVHIPMCGVLVSDTGFIR
jgi:hypothetical protein